MERSSIEQTPVVGCFKNSTVEVTLNGGWTCAVTLFQFRGKRQ